MGQEHIEEYLGAIFRLRESAAEPLPLGALQEYFGFSPISIHEMVQKLEGSGLVAYTPYKGVILTPQGEGLAAALVRRHRIWECFLTDQLNLSWDLAHQVAGELEHAAPEIVTERLVSLLGNPAACPHGGKIPPTEEDSAPSPLLNPSTRLAFSPAGRTYQVNCFSPEVPEYLKLFQDLSLLPGAVIRLLQSSQAVHTIQIEDRFIELPDAAAQTVRVSEVR